MRNNYQSQPQNFMLRQLREHNNLSREQLAVAIGVSSATIKRWEMEGKCPALTIDEWFRLCEALNLKFTELPTYFHSSIYSLAS